MRRLVRLCVLGLVCPAWAWAAPAGFAPAKRTIAQKDAITDVHIEYPETGDHRIDADIRTTVNKIADSFRQEAKAAHEDKDSPYTLDVTYRIARNDRELFAVVFNDEWDFHGAHPNLEIVTANYFREGSWRVFLPELFDRTLGVKRISELARADLDKRLLAGGASDREWIARGTGAHWDSFQAFVLLADALEIEYSPYQVAAYADGPQSSRLPLAKLRDVMRTNPRAPVASFDCEHAENENERAICSDVALARLDRDVSEIWSSQLRNENDPKRKAVLKTSQLAWLNGRDKVCAGGNRVQCLTGYYHARLNALDQ